MTKNAKSFPGNQNGLQLPFTATGLLAAKVGDKVKYGCVASIIHHYQNYVYVITSGHCCYEAFENIQIGHVSLDETTRQKKKVRVYKAIIAARFNFKSNGGTHDSNGNLKSPISDTTKTLRAFGGAYYPDFKKDPYPGGNDWCVIRFDDGSLTETYPHLKLQYVTKPPKSEIPLILSTYWTPEMSPPGTGYKKKYIAPIKGTFTGNPSLIRVGKEFTANGMSGSPFVLKDNAKDKIRGILMGGAANDHDQIVRITKHIYDEILQHIQNEMDALHRGNKVPAPPAGDLTGNIYANGGVTNAKLVNYDMVYGMFILYG